MSKEGKKIDKFAKAVEKEAEISFERGERNRREREEEGRRWKERGIYRTPLINPAFANVKMCLFNNCATFARLRRLSMT